MHSQVHNLVDSVRCYRRCHSVQAQSGEVYCSQIPVDTNVVHEVSAYGGLFGPGELAPRRICYADYPAFILERHNRHANARNGPAAEFLRWWYASMIAK